MDDTGSAGSASEDVVKCQRCSEVLRLDDTPTGNVNALRITPDMLRPETQKLEQAIRECIIDPLPVKIQALDDRLMWEIRSIEEAYRIDTTNKITDEIKCVIMRDVRTLEKFLPTLADMKSELHARDQDELWPQFLKRHGYKILGDDITTLVWKEHDPTRKFAGEYDSNFWRERLQLGYDKLRHEQAWESGYHACFPTSGTLRSADKFYRLTQAIERVMRTHNINMIHMNTLNDAIRGWREGDYQPDYLHFHPVRACPIPQKELNGPI